MLPADAPSATRTPNQRQSPIEQAGIEIPGHPDIDALVGMVGRGKKEPEVRPQRAPEHGVHHAEDRRVHPDAERDRHDDDERVAGRSP
jgi:hypothetical protein